VTITAAQYEQMKERVAKPRRLPAPVASAQTTVGASHLHEVILGVDPSLRGTGYGIIRLARTRPELLVAGTIACPSAWERSRCLVRISAELRDLLKRFHPTACAMEGVFYAQNLQTAIIMGEARGAALAAVAEAGLEIFEIAPRKVKQAMVGYGAAQKLAVAKMVQRMLQLPEVPAPDAADALALALTHAQEQRRHGLLQPRRL
jgi:crossover junction endodeoxyribonuclease RuvC